MSTAGRNRELDPIAGMDHDTGLRRFARAQEGVGAIVIAANDQGAAVQRNGAEMAARILC